MKRFLMAVAASLAFAGPAAAQQAPDRDADLSVATPDYPRGAGPRIAVDSGHNEINTLDQRFALTGRLLSNDGYRVADFDKRFDASTLGGFDVLVIANPRPLRDAAGRDVSPSFTPVEAAALKAWVEGGGALLLIVDHTPFAQAIPPIAEAFGIEWHDGYVTRGGQPEIFSRADGTLADHAITRGDGGGAPVTQVQSFTGSGFIPPKGASPLMILDDRSMLISPEVGSVGEITPDSPRKSAGGLLQGAAWDVGKGRVVAIGEAAMFNAQVAGPNRRKAGFNVPGAEQNKQFLFNILRWLTRR